MSLNHENSPSLIKSKVKAYLNKIDFVNIHGNYEPYLDFFLQEMDAGLQKNESSLAMLVSYLHPPHLPLKQNDPVLILDAGGTNLRCGIFYLNDNNEYVIEDFRKTQMPGFSESLTKKEFFAEIADLVGDLCLKTDRIGFCFSYPTEIMPNKDGRLLYFTKEIKALEVENSFIGQELIDELKGRFPQINPKIVMLNDTVATAFAHYGNTNHDNFDAIIGIIFGTGANSCYAENKTLLSSAVQESVSSDNTFINLEHGNFSGFPRSKVDVLFDQSTNNPDTYHFEKMTSGGYIVPLLKAYFNDALTAGLFDDKDSIELAKKIDQFDLNAFDNLMKRGYLHERSHTISLDNLEKMYYLCSAVVKRAAGFVATNIAALILRTDKGHSPLRPIAVAVDGSTFYGYKNFPHMVKRALDKMLKGEQKRYYELIQVENAPMVGAGIAALSNLT